MASVGRGNCWILVHAQASCRGKGLGGSSAINFLCYNKPSSREMDGQCHYVPNTSALAIDRQLQISSASETRVGIGKPSSSTMTCLVADMWAELIPLMLQILSQVRNVGRVLPLRHII
jgi:hypothetical protein